MANAKAIFGGLLIVIVIIYFASSSSVETIIYAQADNTCIIKHNGMLVGNFDGWGKVSMYKIKTKPKDIIEFVVDNAGGPGALKATVKRGNITYKTGSMDFKISDGSEIIDVATTGWKWAVDGPWNEAKDVAIDHLDSKWIWNKNLCETCTVSFKLLIQ